MNDVLTGQKTKDNIQELIRTEAVRSMVSDLYHDNIDPRTIDFSVFNNRYESLGGSVFPRTLGAVQDACIILWDKCIEIKNGGLK